jgi:hypothetical protein
MFLMKRTVRAMSLGTAAIFVGLGCGGSGSNSSNNGGPGMGGNITTTSFVIPAGTAQTVTSNLVVHASKSIEIDGTLLIPSGVNVSLFSNGPLTIKGSIAPAPATAKVSRIAA